MRNYSRNIGKLLMFTGLALGLGVVQSNATTIVVRTKNIKPDLNSMKLAATLRMEQFKAAKQSGSAALLPENEGFEYAISENSVLGREFSVGPGVSAFFWSDGPVEFAQGFDVIGGSADFESESNHQLLAKKGAQPAGVLVAKTTLMLASMQGSNLHLSYALSKPGPVRAEVFGVKGQSLGKWSWEESASGMYTRDLNVNSAFGNKGMLIIHWTSGDTRLIQKVLVNK